MTPAPLALGLFLCEQVIVDQRTKNPSPINVFTGMAVEGFPSGPQRFSVFASLTDALGRGTMELIGVRLDTGERFYVQRYPAHFPDRHVIVNFNIRVRGIRFPAAGSYDFRLLVDGESVAQRRIRVYQGLSAE